MTLNVKSVTSIAIATVMIGLAAWASLHVLVKPDTQKVVGVVEIGDIQ